MPTARRQVPGPRAKEYLERDAEVISPSYTRSYPFVMDHGQGSLVWDVDGNQFIDFTAGIAVNATGHCHPEVVQAIKDQADKFIHMSGTDFYYTVQTELAEQLNRIVPGNYPKQVFFTNSGTESRRGGVQAGPLFHRVLADDCLHRRLPRTQHGCAVAHGVQVCAPSRLFAACTWSHARALWLLLPLRL